jgi:hypothetical protein
VSAPVEVESGEDARWSVVGAFLEALARGDFATMRSCLDPAVQFRALVPHGLIERTDADATIAQFRTWFGGHRSIQVVDASIGQVGPRAYLRWRIQRAPGAAPGSAEVIEHHVFVTVHERIEYLDLLSSGFHAVRADKIG